MARVCVRHPFEHSDNLCGHCGLEFCRDCLVYPNGPRKHALCVPCALAASGVRSTAGNRPAMTKRELKKAVKERHQEAKALARLERQAERLPSIDNPFSAGWAMTDDDFGSPATLPPPPPPPAMDPAAVQPAPAFVEAAPVERAPTLADLLPTMAPREDTAAAALASLPTREQELGWDQQGDPEEPDRSRRGLPFLRRNEPEPDTSKDSSEMIAWLDEVFAPREQ